MTKLELIAIAQKIRKKAGSWQRFKTLTDMDKWYQIAWNTMPANLTIEEADRILHIAKQNNKSIKSIIYEGAK